MWFELQEWAFINIIIRVSHFSFFDKTIFKMPLDEILIDSQMSTVSIQDAIIELPSLPRAKWQLHRTFAINDIVFELTFVLFPFSTRLRFKLHGAFTMFLIIFELASI